MGDSQRRIVVEGVDFAGLFRFPSILRAATMAFQPPRLILGLLLTVTLLTAGRLWDGLTEPRVSPRGLSEGAITQGQLQELQEAFRDAIAGFGVDATLLRAGVEGLNYPDVMDAVTIEFRRQHDELDTTARESTGDEREAALERLAPLRERYHAAMENIDRRRPRGTFEATVDRVVGSFNGVVHGIVSLDPQGAYTSARDLVAGTAVAAWRHDRWFTVTFAFLLLVVVAPVGAALCRMTAIEFASGERLTVQEGLGFALRRWRRLVFALLLPLLFAVGLTLLLAAGGLLLALPGLDVVGGLLYGLALLIGFGIVFVLAGYALGFPLLLPAVASENCDAADAFQRAYAYAVTRPLHLVGYLAVSAIGLALGYFVSALFAATALQVTGAVIQAVSEHPAVAGASAFSPFDLAPQRAHGAELSMNSAASAWLVTFWQTVVVCLVAGYAVANFFGASTITYLLMRRACDGQEPREVWREQEPGFEEAT